MHKLLWEESANHTHCASPGFTHKVPYLATPQKRISSPLGIVGFMEGMSIGKMQAASNILMFHPTGQVSTEHPCDILNVSPLHDSWSDFTGDVKSRPLGLFRSIWLLVGVKSMSRLVCQFVLQVLPLLYVVVWTAKKVLGLPQKMFSAFLCSLAHHWVLGKAGRKAKRV